MKRFTKEMATELNARVSELRGTADYTRYDMPMEGKDSKGKWKFLLWCIPCVIEGVILTRKNKEYIVVENGYGDLYRWEVSEPVKELLNI
jgi:hypothetical protein